MISSITDYADMNNMTKCDNFNEWISRIKGGSIGLQTGNFYNLYVYNHNRQKFQRLKQNPRQDSDVREKELTASIGLSTNINFWTIDYLELYPNILEKYKERILKYRRRIPLNENLIKNFFDQPTMEDL